MVEPQHPHQTRAAAARYESVRLRAQALVLVERSEARIRRSAELLSASAQRLEPDHR